MTACFCAFDQTLSPLRNPARLIWAFNASQVSARIRPTTTPKAQAKGMSLLVKACWRASGEPRITIFLMQRLLAKQLLCQFAGHLRYATHAFAPAPSGNPMRDPPEGTAHRPVTLFMQLLQTPCIPRPARRPPSGNDPRIPACTHTCA